MPSDLPNSPLANVVDKRPHLAHSGIMGRVRSPGGGRSPGGKSQASAASSRARSRTAERKKRPATAGAASSHGGGSEHGGHKKMSEKRMQKLLYLREREEMKDALMKKVG